MSPEQEQLLRDIHAALVGPLGNEESGLIFKVNNHEGRINSLERWRWYLLGGGVVLAFLIKVAAAAIK